MCGHEALQLAHERRVAAELELRVDPVLLCRHAQLVEPRRLEPGEVLVVEIRERRAAPELEPRAQQPGPRRRLRLARLPQQALESVAVDGIARHGQPVPGRLGDEDVPSDQLAQRRDRVLQRPGRGRRRILAPEVDDETVGRDRLAGTERERSEQCALLAPGQRNGRVAVPHLDRSEQADLHRRVVTPRTSKANRPDERRVTAT